MISMLRHTAQLAATALVLVGCGDATNPGASTTTPTPVPVSSTVPRAPVERVVVTTYFSRGGIIAAGSRAIAKDDSSRGAVAAIIDGPNTDELTAGYGTAIPSGTSLRSVSIEQRKATVDLSAGFTTGGDSLSMRLRVAQIVYTLTRLGVADSARFMIDGKAVESIGGEGLIVTNVRPEEFDDLLPPVLTEFPTPGATVAPVSYSKDSRMSSKATSSSNF